MCLCLATNPTKHVFNTHGQLLDGLQPTAEPHSRSFPFVSLRHVYVAGLPNHERSSVRQRCPLPACLAFPDVSSTRWDKAQWPRTSVLQIYPAFITNTAAVRTQYAPSFITNTAVVCTQYVLFFITSAPQKSASNLRRPS